MSVPLQTSRKQNSEFRPVHHAGSLNLAKLGELAHPEWGANCYNVGNQRTQPYIFGPPYIDRHKWRHRHTLLDFCRFSISSLVAEDLYDFLIVGVDVSEIMWKMFLQIIPGVLGNEDISQLFKPAYTSHVLKNSTAHHFVTLLIILSYLQATATVEINSNKRSK